MNKKKVLLGSGILVVLIVAMVLLWTNFREKPVEGSKVITIEVINSKEESEVYELKTDAEFLEQAMKEAKEEGLIFEAVEDQYGLVVTSVNGEKAVYAEDKAYWSFEVNGEYCMNGISTQAVKDGDAFEIIYTKAE